MKDASKAADAVIANLADTTGVNNEARTSAGPARTVQETDVWWGSYSGWTMMPSLVVCIVLTGFIAWFTWVMFSGGRSGLVQLTFLGLAGGVWLFQTLRWAYRVFSYNYRLTSRRVFRDHGFGTKRRHMVDLAEIAEVRVKRTFYEQLVGVGRVVLFYKNNTRRPLVLSGIRQPRAVAELIRTYTERAKQSGLPTSEGSQILAEG